MSLCVALSAEGTLHAADPTQQRELLLFEDVPITAAAKRPQKQSDAAASVTVVTREEIRRFGYRTLGEALRAQRGLYVSYDRNYTYLGVRGFLRPGDYSNRVLLLVNGHTLNDDIFQSGYFGYDFGIDIETIERIEIIRGPHSALYGGNALFAVINVITANAVSRPGVTVAVETGSFERKRGYVSGGHVFRNGLEVFAAGSVIDLDGHDELFYREFASPQTNDGVAEDADGEKAINLHVNARYGGFSLQGGANRRDKTIPTGAYDTVFNDRDTETQDGRYFGELSYTHELPGAVTLDGRAYYDGLRYKGRYPYPGEEGRQVLSDLGVSHWLGGEIRGSRQFATTHRVTVGSEYSYHPRAHQRADDSDGTVYFTDSQEFGSWGIYAQDEWSVLPSLTITAGGRFDRFYDSDDELTPRAGAVWSPLERTRFKVLYGRAFRPPNLYEQYYADGVTNLPNPALRPERITAYEGIVEHDASQSTQLIASVFHYRMKNLIEQTIAGESDDRLIFRNTTSAEATGAELELRTAIVGGVHGRAAYSIQDVQIDDRWATNSPRHLGSVGLLFPLRFRVEGGIEALVLSGRKTLAGRSTGTQVIPNLSLVARELYPGLKLTAGFYNFLNQPYSDPGAAEHVQDKIQQDRFTYLVGVRYSF